MAEIRKKRSILSRLRNYFFAGAVVLIPIGITLYLSLFIIKISTKLLPKELNPNNYLPFEIPGVEIIIAIFLYIASRIIKSCFNQDNEFIKISLSGLASLLIFQTFIHAGVNTNLLPTTGMTLPFLSYGGSSLMSSAILAGLVLNYTKNKTYLYD